MRHGQETSDKIAMVCIIILILLTLFSIAWKVAAFWGVAIVTLLLVGTYIAFGRK